jgi:hypothetical protein
MPIETFSFQLRKLIKLQFLKDAEGKIARGADLNPF